ncbi:AAA family ATPase [Pseudomonas sp. GM74]|uniref:AAA family ATPase n=1 Tax=Pseudomonas sp. GM74 TaxID=1144336 RepID=UPI0002EBC473|nr:ATP-binding protein [Pseudomonas sp. GM74]
MPPAPATVPPAGAHPPPPFIGRTDEISRLQRAWERADGGQRAVVWRAGEPGIGKTTLIGNFLASLGGITCARDPCVEHYGTGEPYLPVLVAGLTPVHDALQPGITPCSAHR